MHLGETYRRMKRYDNAVDNYSLAITLKPKSVRALTGRGHALFDMGAISKAFADFSTALTLRPNYAWALLGRGRVFGARARTAEALNDFERAAQMNAEYEHVAQKEIGKALVRVMKHEDAASAFIKAVDAGPRCIDCWTLLVQSLKASTNTVGAVERVHHAIPIGEL